MEEMAEEPLITAHRSGIVWIRYFQLVVLHLVDNQPLTTVNKVFMSSKSGRGCVDYVIRGLWNIRLPQLKKHFQITAVQSGCWRTSQEPQKHHFGHLESPLIQIIGKFQLMIVEHSIKK